MERASDPAVGTTRVGFEQCMEKQQQYRDSEGYGSSVRPLYQAWGFGASGLLGYELRAWKDYVSRRTVAFSGCCMLKRRGSTVEGMSRVYNQLNIPARVVF